MSTTDAVNEIIKILSKVNPDDFNMDISSLCIAGYIQKHKYPNSHLPPWSVTKIFSEFTGVDTDTAKLATHPYMETNPAWEATPAQAIKMLEILRDEGVVDWRRAIA